MNTAVNLHVQNLVRRYESDCSSAAARIRTLRSIEEVVRAARVSANPLIRSLVRSLPAHKALDGAASRRLDELIQAQLDDVELEPDVEKRKEILGRLRSRDWEFLRGDYAMQWRRADAGATRLIHAPR